MTQFRPFSATVRQANGAAIIDLHGEINANAEAVLNGAYAEAMPGPAGPPAAQLRRRGLHQ